MKNQLIESKASGVKVDVTRSITEIEPALWDSLNAPHGLYRTHRFFSCVESAEIEGAEYWYFMLSLDSDLVATAVMSSFVISLDLLLPSWVQNLCARVRRFLPSFFRLRMLFCGVPVSIGKNTLTIAEKISTEFVISELHRHMMQVAEDNGIRYLCFKEFTEKDVPALESLREEHRYFRAHSIPRVDLNLRWRSFDEYLNSMRHGYRRMVRQSLSRLGMNRLAGPVLTDDGSNSPMPRLVARRFTREMAAVTHELYLEVMRKTEVKLEVLNRRFFENLATEMPDDLVSICLVDQGEIHGTALLGRNGDCLNFLFAGFRYGSRDRYQTYFNLLNGIVAFGIEQGFEKIDMGQTTYWPKQRLGGEAEPVYFYFRALSPIIHRTLHLFNRMLFPAVRLRPHCVFRKYSP